MLKQKLSQKMLQKLSPQQIQLMKLLQIPTATLEQRVKEELEANPALDEGNESRNEVGDKKSDDNESGELEDQDEVSFELDDYLEEYMEDDPLSYYSSSSRAIDEEQRDYPVVVEDTFHEYLISQLGLRNLKNERKEIIAKQIIGSIDDDGYLRRDPIALIDDLMFGYNIDATEEEILDLLNLVQDFDPPGVAARDLKECLLIQLKRKMRHVDSMSDEQQDSILVAFKILNDHFNEFTKKHYNKLIKSLEISNEELKMAMEHILKLNPKPASAYSVRRSGANHYIIPDFIIENRDGELSLSLNARNAPDLRVNTQYQDMLHDYKAKKQEKKVSRKDKEAVLFIKQKIDSAKWFIDAIRQRQHTMYKTMYAIMQYQYDYFLTGDERRLKPMILKDIGDITGLDISTVSRVANSKYVQTEFGTRRLKDFFSESMQTESGEEVSTLEIKNILADIVKKENKSKPLSDEKLKNHLKEKGYSIARRTVAKYREQLGIPVARLRKEL